MTCPDRPLRAREWSSHLRAVALALLTTTTLAGCWLEAPAPLPPFDCATIDRAAERFPDECGDGGVDLDAGLDADVDSGP